MLTPSQLRLQGKLFIFIHTLLLVVVMLRDENVRAFIVDAIFVISAVFLPRQLAAGFGIVVTGEGGALQCCLAPNFFDFFPSMPSPV